MKGEGGVVFHVLMSFLLCHDRRAVFDRSPDMFDTVCGSVQLSGNLRK